MLYKVQYKIKESKSSIPEIHHRYYRALSPETALEMFKGTCEETLNGYDAEPTAVFEKELTTHQWSPIKRCQ